MSGDIHALRCLRTKQARFISTDRAFFFKMAEGKKAFILYVDQKEIFEQLPDELAGQLIKHIFKYCNDEEPETENIMLNLAFTPIKQQLKRDLKKWENLKGDRSNAGILGNLKRYQPDLYHQVQNGEIDLNEAQRIAKDRKAIQSNTNIAVTDTVTVKDTVTDTVKVSIEERKRSFAQKVINHFDKEFPLNDLQEFCDYWTEHGENDRKMKFEKVKSFDWNLRVRNWMKRRDKFKGNQNNKPKPPNAHLFQS